MGCMCARLWILNVTLTCKRRGWHPISVSSPCTESEWWLFWRQTWRDDSLIYISKNIWCAWLHRVTLQIWYVVLNIKFAVTQLTPAYSVILIQYTFKDGMKSKFTPFTVSILSCGCTLSCIQFNNTQDKLHYSAVLEMYSWNTTPKLQDSYFNKSILVLVCCILCSGEFP